MIAQQKLLNVLVIGDTCTDIYYKCRNTRLNPESSAPLVQVSATFIKRGMAANVALCLEELGINVTTLFSDSNSSKTRYINAITNEQLLRVDFEDKIEPCSEEQVVNLVAESFDAIVISDYDKGFLSINLINLINRLAKFHNNTPVFLDTKKKDLGKFDTNIYLKINEHEANAATKVPRNAIVTMGGAGATWYNERWPAYKSNTVDVCGAGDAFLAGLVYGYLTSPDECIEHGIVNAGISVRHVGTYSPTLKELKEGLNEYYQQCRKN